MADRNRHHLLAQELERSAYGGELESRLSATLLALVEDVGEDLSHPAHGLGGAEAGNRPALAEVEDPEIVEAENVIGMRVGVEDGIPLEMDSARPTSFANPKSATFTRPRRSRRIFSGLMSR